jgi:uncharacterized phage-like protein YoqJ
LDNVIAAGDFSCDESSTCCFTGHRSRALPDIGDMSSQLMKILTSRLNLMIQTAYREGYRTFISGMSEGIDLCCAEIVLAMKRLGGYEGIKLICAVPYPGQFKEMKNAGDRYRYYACMKGCDAVIYVSPEYSKGCYRERNAFMVEHSSRLISVVDPANVASGTMQTVRLAEKKGIEIITEDIGSICN